MEKKMKDIQPSTHPKKGAFVCAKSDISAIKSANPKQATALLANARWKFALKDDGSKIK